MGASAAFAGSARPPAVTNLAVAGSNDANALTWIKAGRHAGQ
jgi:hypothetical protein